MVNFVSGMKFTSMEQFRIVVRDYGIKKRRGIKFLTNDAHRAQLVCETCCLLYI